MKKLFEWGFDTIAKFKVYFSSAGLYLSVVNFLMILATFKLTYGIDISAFILVPLGFIGVIILGYLDYILILKYQTKHSNKKNDLKHQMNRIEKKLDKLLENR